MDEKSRIDKSSIRIKFLINQFLAGWCINKWKINVVLVLGDKHSDVGVANGR